MDRTNISHQVQAGLINQDTYAAEILQKVIQAPLDEKFHEYINADEYERDLQVRVGSITLRICRDREGGFKHDIFEKYQRSEQAFIAALIEMYVNGISTRKISTLVEELCGATVSTSLVSKLTASIEPMLHLWRERPLKS